jgi:glycosyltransferase involved in cell wall biosynthesis
MNNLTLIIPAKYERESLPTVLDEILKINLGCKLKICLSRNDLETIDAIKKYPVEVLFQKNLGYGAAITEGIENNTNEFFCIFNADGSFNPNELPNMMKLMQEKNLDFLFASRYSKNSGSDDDTLLTWTGNKIFSLIGKILFNLPISDILYTYTMGKTSSFKKLSVKENDFRLCVELPIKAKKFGLRFLDISSYERPRIAGKKKVNAFRDGFLILSCMLKLFLFK